MAYKTKEQAGTELLAAIDAYIDAAMAERNEAIRSKRTARFLKYVEEHKNDTIHIPDDARGPYAQSLREESGV